MKLVDRACRNKKGRPRISDNKTTGTGRNRENHAPNGNDAVAAVTHQTP